MIKDLFYFNYSFYYYIHSFIIIPFATNMQDFLSQKYKFFEAFPLKTKYLKHTQAKRIHVIFSTVHNKHLSNY